ncbi:MAG: (2Fe-2S)-binding protein [Sporichthyaceae bacterium]
MSGTTSYELTVNGRAVEVQADDDTSLLHVLRHELALAGPRFGCGVGLCGACFVLLEGKPTPACDTPMWAAASKRVVTVEGFANGDVLHPVQQAFLDEQAAQCGFCVSGVLVSAVALLADNPQPDESAVLAALDRNLCRCGVQRRMVAAVLRAASSEEQP